MKKKHLETFETTLLAMKSELESSIARLLMENDAVTTTDDGVDMQDEVSLENESRNETALIQQQRHELDEVNHALSKIKNGTYGVCEASGDKIPLERLQAVPHARYCIEEQREAEL
ncbi:TraR/DksA C4-type zinc finger protein [Sulfurimonas sp. HSL-3221]|uniref:TraR/DksA family transcriptional regulator n=1 Tax=Thiomicrolovo sulfuroxydans TaxID=2894755 RepID=UPI001E403125|nr:TraR/DksA C4-type zinc finger protein [Sulfurimonas sp. HSL-3221]UFS63587.1 TraR/DksA C4-type zinc finger protein [Sulfurimonas sp. HSL-3221]